MVIILDCLSGDEGSIPSKVAKVLLPSSTAVVQLTVNQLVVGSIPTSGAKIWVGCSNGRAADCKSVASASRFDSYPTHHIETYFVYSPNTSGNECYPVRLVHVKQHIP